MNKNLTELDVDHIGSQDPALQPTAEEFAALSAYLRERRPHNEALLKAYRQAEEAERASLLQEAGQAV